MLVLILLCFACACFAINSYPPSGLALNLDQLGKALLVAALIAHLF